MPTFQFGSDDIHNMEARIAELTAEVASLREALTLIRVYANDTLSGPVDPADDTKDWQRAAVIELRNRAGNALKEGCDEYRT